MDVTPRIRTWTPPPGAPEFVEITAPGTFPCNACSTLCDDTRLTSSALTIATALARLRFSIVVACPVITTWSSWSGSSARATRSSVSVAGTVMVRKR